MKALPLLTLWLTISLSAAEFRTVDVGRNPESVTRGFNGNLCVTLMGERAPAPAGLNDGQIVIIEDNQPRVLAAGFVDPKGIVFQDGRLLTADMLEVWSIAADGTKTLLAGPDAFPIRPRYLNDVALAPQGGIYVTDMGRTDRMRGPDGNLWTLDSDDARDLPAEGRIFHLTPTGQVTLVVDANPLNPCPNGVDALPDGSLLIAEFFTGNIMHWKDGVFTTIAPGLRTADGIVHDDQGNFFASEVGTGRVWRLAASGGGPVLITEVPQSAADHYLDPVTGDLIVPDTKAGQLVFIPSPATRPAAR